MTALPHKRHTAPEREKGTHKFDFSTKGVLKMLVLTGTGRTVAILTVAALTFGVLMRSQTAAVLGFGALPFFAWAAIATATVNIRPELIVRQWRVFSGSFALCFAVTGLLGMIGANAGSATGLSLGGALGTTIASAPDHARPGVFSTRARSSKCAAYS